MMKSPPAAYLLRHTALGHTRLDLVCADLTAVLQRSGTIRHYSQRLSAFSITFDILPAARFGDSVHTSAHLDGGTLHLNIPIAHPHFLVLDEEELRQYLAELVLEAILIAAQYDGTLCAEEWYHSVKFHFYRRGWFTRLIFPAA